MSCPNARSPACIWSRASSALGGDAPKPELIGHPIVLMARAYGVAGE